MLPIYRCPYRWIPSYPVLARPCTPAMHLECPRKAICPSRPDERNETCLADAAIEVNIPSLVKYGQSVPSQSITRHCPCYDRARRTLVKLQPTAGTASSCLTRVVQSHIGRQCHVCSQLPCHVGSLGLAPFPYLANPTDDLLKSYVWRRLPVADSVWPKKCPCKLVATNAISTETNSSTPKIGIRIRRVLQLHILVPRLLPSSERGRDSPVCAVRLK